MVSRHRSPLAGRERHALGALAALAIGLLHACSAHARNVYVAPGAQGRGETRVTPAGDLAEAIRGARPGDVLLLARGTYAGGIWVETSGAPGRPITIRPADGPGTVVIDGGAETLNIGGGAHHLVFEGLELRNGSENIVHVQGGAHHIVLRDLVVHDAGDDGDGIKVNQARDILIERVECYHPGRRPDRPGGNPAQECIDMVDVERAVVQDSYLHDGGNMLLYAKGASRDVVFQRNVITGQGPDAIDPCVGIGAWTDRELLRGRQYEAEEVVFRNNVVTGCRAGAVGVYDARRVWIVNNTLIDDGPDVIEFRAGNAPRAESRDVHIINNIIADTRGGMRRALAHLSHRVADVEVRNNLYWNGGRPVPTDGMIDPNRAAAGTCGDPGIGPATARAPGQAACMRYAGVPGQSPAVDRGVTLQGIGAVRDDVYGRRRPSGRGIDIGAVEVGGVVATEPANSAVEWPSQLATVTPAVFNVTDAAPPQGTGSGVLRALRTPLLGAGAGAVALAAVGALVYARSRPRRRGA